MSTTARKRVIHKSRSVQKAPGRDARLDAVFSALSDTTRRRILERLAHGPATVTELGQPFKISAPAITRHLKILEATGFIVRTVDGRVHSCALNPAPIAEADKWMDLYRQFWESTFDSLQAYAEQHQK